MYSCAVGCGVDPRNIAQRIMSVSPLPQRLSQPTAQGLYAVYLAQNDASNAEQVGGGCCGTAALTLLQSLYCLVIICPRETAAINDRTITLCCDCFMRHLLTC